MSRPADQTSGDFRQIRSLLLGSRKTRPAALCFYVWTRRRQPPRLDDLALVKPRCSQLSRSPEGNLLGIGILNLSQGRMHVSFSLRSFLRGRLDLLNHLD